MHEHLDIATGRSVAVRWINLTCEAGEHKARIVSDERKIGTTKCTDPALLDELERKEGTALLIPGDMKDSIGPLVLDYLQLDTSEKEPEDCAETILKWTKC